ncbi:MAG: SAM-dependent methyltransferase [Bacillota bacterium]
MAELFDMKLRAARRDRAERIGAELFLFERAFEDCLERVMLLGRRFERALLIGCPDPQWPSRLAAVAAGVDVCDPGPLFARAAGGAAIIEDAWQPSAGTYDLVFSVGALDTVNDLPLAVRLIGYSMKAQGLFIGALSGGDTVPQLRAAMRAADAPSGGAAAHVHPRIEPSALAPLLENAGFIRPVVDVDRVQVSYRELRRLVADLRAMGASNILNARAGPLTRAQFEMASRAFREAGDGERTIETFEILHFAGWRPANI